LQCAATEEWRGTNQMNPNDTFGLLRSRSPKSCAKNVPTRKVDPEVLKLDTCQVPDPIRNQNICCEGYKVEESLRAFLPGERGIRGKRQFLR